MGITYNGSAASATVTVRGFPGQCDLHQRNPLRWEREVHQMLVETAEAVMNRSPYTCDPAMSLQGAAALLHEAGTERLFVVDSGTLTGVFSRADLVRARAAKDDASWLLVIGRGLG